jgi:hypothetical protein
MFFSRGRGDRKKAMFFMRIYRSVVGTIGFPEDVDYARILNGIRSAENSSDVFIQMVLALGLRSTPGLHILRSFSDKKFNDVDIHKMMNREELIDVFNTLSEAMFVLEGVDNSEIYIPEPTDLFNSFRNYTISEIKSRKYTISDLMSGKSENKKLEKRLRLSFRRVNFEK